MKRRAFVACLASPALAGCLESLPGVSSDDSGLEITGVRHDDSSDYEGWAETYKNENVVIKNTADSAINLEGKVLRYDGSHSVALPDIRFVSDAQLIVLSQEGGSAGLNRMPPVHIRSAGFENPESVLEHPGTVTLLDESGDTIDQQEY